MRISVTVLAMGAILDITSKWLPSNKGTNTKTKEVVEYNKRTGVKASNGYDKHNNIKGWYDYTFVFLGM